MRALQQVHGVHGWLRAHRRLPRRRNDLQCLLRRWGLPCRHRPQPVQRQGHRFRSAAGCGGSTVRCRSVAAGAADLEAAPGLGVLREEVSKAGHHGLLAPATAHAAAAVARAQAGGGAAAGRRVKPERAAPAAHRQHPVPSQLRVSTPQHLQLGDEVLQGQPVHRRAGCSSGRVRADSWQGAQQQEGGRECQLLVSVAGVRWPDCRQGLHVSGLHRLARRCWLGMACWVQHAGSCCQVCLAQCASGCCHAQQLWDV
mmetsp:Transcript_7791/g.19358  ORF Transcript_7791/g.19358 Transcript_7791/m.19358 type:complete len:256 (-) Transcript_7791:588-1355(-)